MIRKTVVRLDFAIQDETGFTIQVRGRRVLKEFDTFEEASKLFFELEEVIKDYLSSKQTVREGKR